MAHPRTSRSRPTTLSSAVESDTVSPRAKRATTKATAHAPVLNANWAMSVEIARRIDPVVPRWGK